MDSKRPGQSRPRRVNAGNKNTLSMHHPQRRNVTTSMVGLKSSHTRKTLIQNGEPQRYSWEHIRRRRQLFAACLTTQRHSVASQGRSCSDSSMCCHTQTKVADQTFYLAQSQYTDTRPTSPSADPLTPGTWQGGHWSTNSGVTGMTWPGERSPAEAGIEPGFAPLKADALAIGPMRKWRSGREKADSRSGYGPVSRPPPPPPPPNTLPPSPPAPSEV